MLIWASNSRSRACLRARCYRVESSPSGSFTLIFLRYLAFTELTVHHLSHSALFYWLLLFQFQRVPVLVSDMCRPVCIEKDFVQNRFPHSSKALCDGLRVQILGATAGLSPQAAKLEGDVSVISVCDSFNRLTTSVRVLMYSSRLSSS